MSKMTLKTEGDKHVVVTRRFAAPPEAVYRAHTEPEIIQKWLLGPDGWTMPVCIGEARPNGKIRYEWTNGKGGGFYLTGEYLELKHYETGSTQMPTPSNDTGPPILIVRFDSIRIPLNPLDPPREQGNDPAGNCGTLTLIWYRPA